MWTQLVVAQAPPLCRTEALGSLRSHTVDRGRLADPTRVRDDTSPKLSILHPCLRTAGDMLLRRDRTEAPPSGPGTPHPRVHPIGPAGGAACG